MPGETITLQVGQCGNQVGLQYWQQLALEHGINSDGKSLPYPLNTNNLRFQQLNNNNDTESETTTTSTKYRNDHPELFFTLSDANTYTPRSILVDMEPSVISKSTSTLPMFNPRNVHLSEQGNGAANNWINGYKYGTEEEERLFNIIDREADKCDNLSNFQLFHSVAGGTGSGVGSKILELLSDRYGHKKLLNTFSIFPSNEGTSDVVVQPYNTILTLKRLIDYSDATFVFHNDSLNQIENLLFNNTFQQHDDNDMFLGANKLIANISASVSNPLRFPGYMYSSIESILSNLIPTPDLKFLTSSIAPFSTQKHNYINEYEMILELSNDRYKTNRVTSDTNYLTMMNYLIGENLDSNEIRKGILKSQQRTPFVPWASRSVQVVHGKKSPFVSNRSLEGVQITNNTSIIEVFNKILRQYDLLIKRKAYVNRYYNGLEEEQEVMDLFSESREAVKRVVDEYKKCKEVNYLDDDDDEEGDLIVVDQDMDI
ncbi:TUB4 Tubulin gamma chain [Candida maltosa Xu316]|uniref:Tubulin gamma chain n=1 Tax=Candida maltosa (strain Xu316) TaxID=1245528 RepID=M3JVP0_CANMX|nr:Gamma-tubulin [Candida maltosa Xu316]